MGSPWSSALTTGTVRDFDFDLRKFFNSQEARDKRLNCQGCKLSCQQHIYFEPQADNLPLILFRILTLPFRILMRRSEKAKNG